MSQIKFNTGEDKEGPELMTAALYVEEADKEEEEEDGRPPRDGMAYLRQVIKERKRVPETVSVEYVGPAKSAKLVGEESEGDLNDRSKVAAPPGWSPGSAWQREQVRQFSEVRLKVGRHAELVKETGEAGHGVHNVPDKKNEALWCHMMLGGEVWREVTRLREEEAGQARTEVTGEEPRLNFMVSVPGHVCAHVLEFLLSWLSLTGWTSKYGPWLYALLVRIEKPLAPEVGSSLRDLALFCARERRRVAASGEEYKEETIAALNLFICLVAKYFDQGDLADREDE